MSDGLNEGSRLKLDNGRIRDSFGLLSVDRSSRKYSGGLGDYACARLKCVNDLFCQSKERKRNLRVTTFEGLSCSLTADARADARGAGMREEFLN